MTLGNGTLRFTFCATLILALSGPGGAVRHKQPPVERMLAGYTTEKHDAVWIRDHRSGYILLRQSECDGSHLHLALYSDKSALKNWVDPEKPIPGGRLPSLQTGRGIHIGDKTDRLRRVMGEPTWQGGSLYTPGERVWSFHHLIGTRAKGIEYISVFRIRNGRVTGIELDREEQPG